MASQSEGPKMPELLSRRGTTRIAVTGHRFLRDETRIRAGLEKALRQVERSFPERPLSVVSPLAEGADRLAARCILERPGSSLVAVLPVPQADYMDDFEADASKADFRDLLGLAEKVLVLPPAPSRAAAYKAAGFFDVWHCDVLVAVWDGQPTRGVGGTAEIVDAALKEGKTVCHIWAGNHSPSPNEHTDVGLRHGRIRYRNLPGQRPEVWSVRVGAPRAWRQQVRTFLRAVSGPMSAYQWPIMLVAALAAVILGYVGFAKSLSLQNGQRSITSILYLTLQLFLLQSGAVAAQVPWELDVARFVAPTLAAYATITVLARVFSEQSLTLRLRLMSDHVVVCGLGRKGFGLMKSFLRQELLVVAIEKNPSNPHIDEARKEGAIVLCGLASSPALLARAGVNRASQVFAVCDEDSNNAQIALQLSKMVSGRKTNPLVCRVHIVDPLFCNLLREWQLTRAEAGSTLIDFFNAYEAGAQALMDEHDPFSDTHEAAPSPHLLVVGAGRMAQALVVAAARSWRTRRTRGSNRVRITLVDLQVQAVAENLRLLYPRLDTYCELISLNMDVHSAVFRDGSFVHRQGLSDVTAVYVCHDDDSLSLFAGLSLARFLRPRGVPVVACLAEETGLTTLTGGLRRKEPGGTLRPFFFHERTSPLPCSIEALARAIHKVYVDLRREKGDTETSNPSMAPWRELGEALRRSNREQASHIGAKLRAMSCSVNSLLDWDAPLFEFASDEVETLARMEHERYLKERHDAAWRYGPKRDLLLKTNPNLVPWGDLPETTREFNRDIVRQTPCHLAAEGFQICRLTRHTGPAEPAG